ncbi:MAG TPA: DUF2721 domain-containing protein [Gemmatimonadales bacterium]|nr:DUF2721 domain-containing protein [Gemmatimonadales bacterium]
MGAALLAPASTGPQFLGAFARFDASVPVALFFVAAMVAFFAGLLFFLREIFIATANLRIGPH